MSFRAEMKRLLSRLGVIGPLAASLFRGALVGAARSVRSRRRRQSQMETYVPRCTHARQMEQLDWHSNTRSRETGNEAPNGSQALRGFGRAAGINCSLFWPLG